MHHAYSVLATESAEPASVPSMIVQVQIRLQCLDERTTGGERRHGLDLEIELTIDECPRDSLIWLQRSKHSMMMESARLRRSNGAQSSSKYSVSPRITSKEPLNLLAPIRRVVYM